MNWRDYVFGRSEHLPWQSMYDRHTHQGEAGCHGIFVRAGTGKGCGSVVETAQWNSRFIRLYPPRQRISYGNRSAMWLQYPPFQWWLLSDDE